MLPTCEKCYNEYDPDQIKGHLYRCKICEFVNMVAPKDEYDEYQEALEMFRDVFLNGKLA